MPTNPYEDYSISAGNTPSSRDTLRVTGMYLSLVFLAHCFPQKCKLRKHWVSGLIMILRMH